MVSNDIGDIAVTSSQYPANSLLTLNNRIANILDILSTTCRHLPTTLMQMFNHSTQKQTLTYLGIQAEEIKSACLFEL